MTPAGPILMFSILLVISMLVAYTTKKHHFIYLPESGSAMLLGMLVGFMAWSLGMEVDFSFEPEVFFYCLLPIIIFNAGYALKKKDFFRNFSTIMLLAVVGTVVSSLVFGLGIFWLYKLGYVKNLNKKGPLLEALLFGSLISSIDPVATLSIFQDVDAPTLLYNLVFGESLVNDATSIVLFRTFSSFLETNFSISTIGIAILYFCAVNFGSIIVGILVSFLCAIILKYIEKHTEFARFELSFILLSGYIAYSLAEILSLSGIMSLFFCGICNSHYGYYNSSHASRISSKYAFEALSFLSEIFVFAYLGMQVVLLKHEVDTGLLAASIPLILISRALNIFPLTWLANRIRTKKIPNNLKTMMWLSGLRGAVAYALAVNLPSENRSIETATLLIVVTTTLGLGGATAPLLRMLGLIPMASSAITLGERSQLDVPLISSNRTDVYADVRDGWPAPSGFHHWFKLVDTLYLKPVLGGSVPLEMDDPQAEWPEIKPDHLQVAGRGFFVSVPSDWIEADGSEIRVLHSQVLANLASGAVQDSKSPEAQVLITRHKVEGEEFENNRFNPMDFLLTVWDNLELAEEVLRPPSPLPQVPSQLQALAACADLPVLEPNIHPGLIGDIEKEGSKYQELSPGPLVRATAVTSAPGPSLAPAYSIVTPTEGSGEPTPVPQGLNMSTCSTQQAQIRDDPSESSRSLWRNPSSKLVSAPTIDMAVLSLGSGRRTSGNAAAGGGLKFAESPHPRPNSVGPSPRVPVPVSAKRTMTAAGSMQGPVPLAITSQLVGGGQGEVRVIPTFVMWAEVAEDVEGQSYFRYELVLHPEDLGLRKADAVHIMLSVSGVGESFTACRVRGVEKWWYDGGEDVAQAMINSFRVLAVDEATE